MQRRSFCLNYENMEPLADHSDSISSVRYSGLSQAEYDKKYGRSNEKPPPIWRKLWNRRHVSISPGCIGRKAESLFPIINMIRTYRLREYILGDIVAGLSVGIMTIPQSMGYAIMASVPPIMGLYTSFFPVLFFCVFTSTRHVTVGTMALASLVHASTIQRATVGLQEQIAENPNDTALIEELKEETVAIAVTVTFMSGLVLIILSLLRFSFLVTYIGEALIAGFLTGSNIRVLTQQLKLNLGVAPIARPGMLEYIYLVYDIGKLVPESNIASIVISVITLGILIFVKYFVNVRYKAKLKLPIPIDLTVVIVATIMSQFLKFNERYGVKTVSYIPKGVPTPSLPSRRHMSPYIFDSIVLAILNYLLIYIMAVLFSKRHNYPVRPNQEMFAVGISNVFSGFFSGIGASISPPRCFIMEATGGRTQLSYLVSSLLILMCMLFLGPLLEALPVCVLASIIIVACIPLFDQYKMGLIYWRSSLYDFSIWLVAALASLLTTIEIGLMIGIGFSFVVVVFRTQRANSATLVNTREGVYVDQTYYSNHLKENPSVIIYRFEGPLYFATIDSFKSKLFKAFCSPMRIKSDAVSNGMETENIDVDGVDMKPQGSCTLAEDVEVMESNVDTPLTARRASPQTTTPGRETLQCIIIDCSVIPFVDTPASTMLAGLVKEFSEKEVRLILAATTDGVRQLLQRVPAWSSIFYEVLYPSIHDAVLASIQLQPKEEEAL